MLSYTIKLYKKLFIIVYMDLFIIVYMDLSLRPLLL